MLIMQEEKNTGFMSKTNKKTFHQDKILRKKIKEIHEDKCVLSKIIYDLLRFLSKNNSPCSEYLFQYLPLFTRHIGHGTFVTQTIKEILLSNEKILEKISSITVKNDNQTSLSLNDGNLVKKTFIDEIFAKLKTFPSFEKSELLDFVSSLCHYKDNAIYNNQQKIFKNLFYKTNNSSSEKVYLFSTFWNETDNKIYAQYRVNDRKVSFPITEYKSSLSEIMQIFLKEQLRLFARLALGRNSTTFKYLKRTFPYEILLEKMFDETLDLEMRAIFCQMAQNLYINAHPRVFMTKPNFIRIVHRKAEEKKTDFEENPFSKEPKEESSNNNSFLLSIFLNLFYLFRLC